MLEYVKNVNVRYVVTITFQEEHAYFTNQHKERTWQVVIGSTTNAGTGRQFSSLRRV